MTKQEIIDELNAAGFRGFGNWVSTSASVHGGDEDESVILSHDKAAREAAALRRNREALSLDAIMPLLEQIAETGEIDWATIGTQHADVVAVVKAWKARRS